VITSGWLVAEGRSDRLFSASLYSARCFATNTLLFLATVAGLSVRAFSALLLLTSRLRNDAGAIMFLANAIRVLAGRFHCFPAHF